MIQDNEIIFHLQGSVECITAREKEETLATESVTSQTLQRLNVTVKALPRRCQQLLSESAELQVEAALDSLDPIAISLQHSRMMYDQIEQEYEIMKLRQKNIELQAKIDKNDKILDSLRRDLECSRQSLCKQNPNPDNIEEYIRQMKQKVASYEDNCERSKAKFTKLNIPEYLYPTSLEHQMSTLARLNDEAMSLRQSAEDARMVREARDIVRRLRR